VTPAGNQRWRERRANFRPPVEPIDPRGYDVAELASDTVARRFVETHHYSGSYPAARFRVGLYRRGELVGVAVLSHPCNDAVLEAVFPTLPRRACVELGRFVLVDDVPGNGETWFLARTFDLLRDRVAGVVSFSDPVPRTDVAGAVVMPGHLGTIYQASNARYLGRGRADTLRLLPDGRVLSRRTFQKVRSGERGWSAAAARLVAFGADELDAGADEAARRAWLETWLARLTRPLRHPGNHRYAWVLQRRHRRVLAAPAAPYPKPQPMLFSA